ncbi:MAG: hypothetical protein AUK47_08925 [Deltaproteobacteria bacterium CG2_30_63_29]|nr:MAG: hypothetical protein AUK47_08925 [Deltaproteobacteria bacterium CG2_30_63_29]
MKWVELWSQLRRADQIGHEPAAKQSTEESALRTLASLLSESACEALLTRVDRLPESRTLLFTLVDVLSQRRTSPAADELECLVRLAAQGSHFRRLLTMHATALDFVSGEHSMAWSGEQDPSSLRLAKRLEVARIFCHEVTERWPLEEVTRAISSLAERCIDAALHLAQRDVSAATGEPLDADGARIPFCVMGLGKLGGNELNYSSDVDLVFVYGSDDGQICSGCGKVTQLSVHEYFVKLGRRLMQILSELTASGYVFRVDMRLRPGGARGPLAHALDAVVEFYEAWGSTWQRAAWLKARPVAGDRALGAALLDDLAPFIYRRYLDYSAIDEIRAMKARIDQELLKEEAPGGLRGWNAKLGYGGIREVEFAVQALQLVYSGSHPQIRTGNTLQAIERLIFSGLVSQADGEALAAAYRFFRRLEHHLQMAEDRQTSVVRIEDPEAMTSLQARLFLPGLNSGGQLVERILGHRLRVHAFFATLMPGAPPPRPAEPALSVLLRRLSAADEVDAGRAEDLEWLAARGFRNPGQAARQLGLLACKPYLPFHEGHPSERLRDHLVGEVVRSPDPDMALANLTRLLTRVGARAGYLDMLLANAQLSSLVITLFASSDFLSKRLTGAPELIEQLASPGYLSKQLGEAELEARLALRLAAIDVEDRDRRLNLLRRFKYEHLMRIGLRAIGRVADTFGTREELSDLATVILRAVFEEARLETEGRFGVPTAEDGSRAKLVVLGLGKLGGREISFASDLDLVFLYEGAGESVGGERSIDNADFFGRFAQRVIAFMSVHLREGKLYSIDTRLRPSGNQGALVTSVSGYRRYLSERAQLWERQSLLRARVLAGDAALGAELQEFITARAYGLDGERVALEDALREIARSRSKMAETLGAATGEQRHLKYGHGGLVDIEFCTQLLQLVYGAQHAALRTPNTRRALQAVRDLGLLAPGSAERLLAAQGFLLALEDSLRIVGDQAIDTWSPRGEELVRLAKRMGYGAGEQLLATVDGHRAAVVAVYGEVFGE